MTAGGKRAVLGVDLGGTAMRAAAVDAGGAIAARASRPTPPADPAALPRLMREAADAAAAAGAELIGAVVGVPAVVDHRRGVALRLPNLPGWEGRLAAQPLADAAGLPLVFANDADLAAAGEHRYGAGRGADDMVYLTIGTGIGAGVILGGRLLLGGRSLAEVGHTLIDYRAGDTLEALGSGTALARLSGLDGAEAERRARAGDAEAAGWFAAIAAAVAAGVANAIECFMPERVVLGGGVAACGDLLLGPVRERLAGVRAGDLLDPAQVVLAGEGDAGLRGAWPLWEECAAPRARAAPIAPFLPRGGGA